MNTVSATTELLLNICKEWHKHEESTESNCWQYDREGSMCIDGVGWGGRDINHSQNGTLGFVQKEKLGKS